MQAVRQQGGGDDAARNLDYAAPHRSGGARLRIYQRELLFLPYAASQDFLSKLYTRADRLNTSFSTNTCLWYDYLNAVGDGLLARPSYAPAASTLAPLSFAEFCDVYAMEADFEAKVEAEFNKMIDAATAQPIA